MSKFFLTAFNFFVIFETLFGCLFLFLAKDTQDHPYQLPIYTWHRKNLILHCKIQINF